MADLDGHFEERADGALVRLAGAEDRDLTAAQLSARGPELKLDIAECHNDPILTGCPGNGTSYLVSHHAHVVIFQRNAVRLEQPEGQHQSHVAPPGVEAVSRSGRGAERSLAELVCP